MRTIRNGPALAVACTLVAIGLAASDQRKPGDGADLSRQRFVLKTDAGDLVGELGHLAVPENRQKPTSRLIRIAFARFKSTAARPGAPIVHLAGGPGSPGIPNPDAGGPQATLRALLQVSDVIYWDQRGANRSQPTTECKQVWDFPLESIRSRQSFVNDARRLAKACVADSVKTGADLSAYTSNASADDLMDLATALGADRIMTLGGSYGSHLSLAAIRRHGARILRAVIMAVEGPDDTYKLPGNVQRQLDKIAALVRKDPTMGRLVPDLTGLIKSVLDRVEAQPVTVSAMDPATKRLVRLTISKFDVQRAITDTLGALPGLRRLPAAVFDMSKGDFSFAAESVLGLRGRSIGSAMAAQIDCASGVSAERKARIEKEAAETLLGDVIDLPGPDVCDAWAPNDLGPAFRGPLVSDVPALFVTGAIDGRTPTSNAEAVRRGFSRQHLIEVENAAHGGYANDPVVLEAIVGFFRTGAMPGITTATMPQIVFEAPRTLQTSIRPR